MACISDGEADLVITSPPYFSLDTDPALRRPLAEQTDYREVLRDVTAFALSLRPVFQEVDRVLKDGGVLVLQTRHIRYGHWLLPLTDLHAGMALEQDLRMVTKLEWLATHPKPVRRPRFLAHPNRGAFRCWDTESWLVFCKGNQFPEGGKLDERDFDADLADLALPLWRTPPAGGHRHPYASPPKVVRRFLELFSSPGDLVVDPFCGFGTILAEARKLGRRAIGFDIDEHCVENAKGRLTR